MPITASINRHPEAESQSETAAPHPEEMKATLDLASRQCRIGQGHRTHHTGRLGSGGNTRSRHTVADHFAGKGALEREKRWGTADLVFANPGCVAFPYPGLFSRLRMMLFITKHPKEDAHGLEHPNTRRNLHRP